MTGLWRGFHLGRSKLEARFPKLLPRQTIPIEVRRDPNLGLHGTKRIMKGFYVTHTNKKIKRIWRPNILISNYRSEILDYTFTFPVAAAVVRQIDKAGSLDAYILYTEPKHLGGKFAIDFQKKLLEVISNNMDIELPPRIIHYPKPPPVLLQKIAKIMDERRAIAVENNAEPSELIALDYSSMQS